MPKKRKTDINKLEIEALKFSCEAITAMHDNNHNESILLFLKYIQILSKIINLSSDKEKANWLLSSNYVYLAIVYHNRNQENDILQSIGCYKQALRYAPNNIQAKIGLGVILYESHQFSEAFSTLDEIITYFIDKEKKRVIIDNPELVEKAVIYYILIYENLSNEQKQTFFIKNKDRLKELASIDYSFYFLMGVIDYEKDLFNTAAVYLNTFLKEFLKQHRTLKPQGSRRYFVSHSHFMLGIMTHLDSNKRVASHHFRMAAECGHHMAQFYLALMIDTHVTEGQPDEAIKWYKLAAEKGLAEACNNLSYKYLNAENVAFNLEEGLKYAEIAAAGGSLESSNRLGGLYFSGEHVPKDLNKAMHYYQLAIKYGSIDANSNLAAVYIEKAYNSEDETKKNEYARNALSFFQNIPEDALTSNAKINLSALYFGFPSLAKNYEKAFRYLAMAANEGNEFDSFKNLFFLYYFISLENSEMYEKLLLEIEIFLKEHSDSGNEIALICLNFIKSDLSKNSALETKENTAKNRHDYILAFHKSRSLDNSPTYNIHHKMKNIINSVTVDELDVISAAVFIYQVMNLYIESGSKINEFAQFFQDIKYIVKKCTCFLVQFDPIGLKVFIIGLSHLYRGADDAEFYDLINLFYNYIFEKINQFSLQDLTSILLATTRFDLAFSPFKSIVTHLTQNILKNLANMDISDLARVIYSTAIFDLHYRKKKQSRYKISINDIVPLITKINSLNLEENTPVTVKNQLCMGLLYFYDKHHELCKNNAELKQTIFFLQQAVVASHSSTTTISKLQHRIACFLKKYYPDCIEENFFNTLPVDIYLPNERLIIQVDGPTHFYASENNIPITKTAFHDRLLLIKPTVPNNNQAHPTGILHLPYYELDTLVTEQQLFNYFTKKFNEVGLEFAKTKTAKLSSHVHLSLLKPNSLLALRTPAATLKNHLTLSV